MTQITHKVESVVLDIQKNLEDVKGDIPPTVSTSGRGALSKNLTACSLLYLWIYIESLSQQYQEPTFL